MKSVGGAIGNSVQLGFLLNNLSENHERYNDWKYKGEADLFDLAGAGAGILVGGAGTYLGGPLVGGIAGVVASSGINAWIEGEKNELAQEEESEEKKSNKDVKK